MKIAYYISDHGLGHAGRAIAVINQLHLTGHEVIARNSTAVEFLQANLPREIKINREKTDIGPVIEPGTLAMNWNKTQQVVEKYINNWPSQVEYEKKFLKSEKIDLLAVDIVPHALIAAQEMNIPSALVSNYSWNSIYSAKLNREIVREITGAYRKCSIQLELPFALKNSEVPKKKRIGLVARRPTETRAKMRSLLKITNKLAGKVAYVAFGGWQTREIINAIKEALSPEWTIISPGLQFNPTTPNGQNYSAAADLVITKGGYSTVSEAVVAKVPIVCASITESDESKVISTTIEREKLGKAIKIEEIANTNVLQEAVDKAIRNYKPPRKQYAAVGECEVVEEIEKI